MEPGIACCNISNDTCVIPHLETGIVRGFQREVFVRGAISIMGVVRAPVAIIDFASIPVKISNRRLKFIQHRIGVWKPLRSLLPDPSPSTG